jgi:hypothetical protein
VSEPNSSRSATRAVCACPRTLSSRLVSNDEIDLIARDGEILIANTHNPREGWEESFAAMAKRNDDKLVMPDVFAEEAFDEWNSR